MMLEVHICFYLSDGFARTKNGDGFLKKFFYEVSLFQKKNIMSRRSDPLDCKVYVGSLPQDATSQEVISL